MFQFQRIDVHLGDRCCFKAGGDTLLGQGRDVIRVAVTALALLSLVWVGGCFPEVASARFQCDPSDPGGCPEGFVCQQRGQSGIYLCYDEYSTEFCGNGRQEAGEACDGSDLGGQTCAGRGWWTGPLACDEDCGLVEDDCRAMLSMAGGELWAAGVDDRGVLWRWGATPSGMIGPGYSNDYRPVRVEAPTSLSDPSLGHNHGCAIDPLGVLYCFGYNGYGELGNGTYVESAHAMRALVPEPVVDVAAALFFTCALTDFGNIYCFGSNTNGQLGGGLSDSNSPLPRLVSGGHEFVSLATGSWHACGVDSDGQAWCWGAGWDGRLGNPAVDGTNVREPVAVVGGHRFTRISVLTRSTCALDVDGAAWCWGRNRYGELGDGTSNNSGVPVLVAGARRYFDLKSSSMHTCATDEAGLWCWGWLVIDGDVRIQASPRLISGSDAGLSGFAPGFLSLCGLSENKKPICQGYNGQGQLGVDPHVAPFARVRNVEQIVALEMGEAGTCALDAQGDHWCWGSGFLTGPLESTSELIFQHPAPEKLDVDTRLHSVCLGDYHACGLAEDGQVWCWGASGSGAHGGVVAIASGIQPVWGTQDFIVLACGSDHVCGVDAGGVTWCWGDNGVGQLGDGTTQSTHQPVVAQTPEPLTALALGENHSCGLDADGHPWCWGSNLRGQLATGDSGSALTPVAASTEVRFETLNATRENVCGLEPNGRAWCWGSNIRGQIGNGTIATAFVPEPVYGEGRYQQIVMGRLNTCALDLQGELWCWGDNLYPAFGHPSVAYLTTPVRIPTPTPFIQIAGAWLDKCGIDAQGQAWCWGSDHNGAQGTLRHQSAFAPVVEPTYLPEGS